MRKKISVVNLGCPKNQVDSEVISGFLSKNYAIASDPQDANIVIVNTCGFILDAQKESIDTIYEMVDLKNNGICEKVFATGCLAQRYGKELFTEIPELDGVLGDGELDTVEAAIDESDHHRIFTHKEIPNFLYNHEMPRIRTTVPYFAYVKIAEGCDNRCTYCAIPSIKGPYRSRAMESILEETRKLAQEGVKEIALVAQDTTRYGMDRYGSYSLTELLRKLVKIEGIEWIRLLYCYPDVFSDELIETIGAEPKICKYIDLPLQHGDNEVLRKMNRRNTAEQAIILIDKLRKAVPGIFIRSTFITGFPGETDKQFIHLLNLVQRIELDRIGVFSYSQEEGTVAARMKDQVPEEIREARKNRVMELQATLAEEIQQKRIGQTIRVILEEKLDDHQWVGRTEGDAPEIDGQIFVDLSGEFQPGDIIKARILRADSYDFGGVGLHESTQHVDTN